LAELGKMKYFDVAELEARLGLLTLPHFVRECEADFLRMCGDIAHKAAWNPRIKAIFISGPSSSGKTTFTNRLSGALHMLGRPTTLLSLDDYYTGKEPIYDEYGRPDFESLDCLDVPLMLDHLQHIINGIGVETPTFNFKTRAREWRPEGYRKLAPRGILLVEGLHGLSEQVCGNLKREQYLTVFLMPYATLNSDRRLLDSRDIRILRRTSRDVLHRNSTAFATLDYWPVMDKAELQLTNEYLARADFYVNTVLGYEFFVVPPLATAYIEKDFVALERGELRQSPYLRQGQMYADLPAAVALGRRLIAVARKLPVISPNIVPEISILNEFIS